MNVRIMRLIDNGVVLVLLAASLCLNVYQWNKANHLDSSSGIPSVGVNIPALSVFDLSGNAATISWNTDKRPTILYVFSPSCVWCRRNLDNVAVLSQSTRLTHHFIGVSTSQEGLTEYVEKNHFGFPVYAVVDNDVAREFKFNVTPSTLEISNTGKVLHSWAGAYGGPILREIQDTFQIRLPGIPMTGFSSN